MHGATIKKKCIHVFCTDLRTNGDYFSLHINLSVFYNRGSVFTARYDLGHQITYSSVLKGLKLERV